MLNGWDILAIILGVILIENIIKNILLFITTKEAIKRAGIIGSTKQEILKQTTDLVKTITKEMQIELLAYVKETTKSEVIRLIDAENKNIALTLEPTKKKRLKKDA